MSLKDRKAVFLELSEARFTLLIRQTPLVLCWTRNKRLTRVSWTRLPVAPCSGWQEAVSLHIKQTSWAASLGALLVAEGPFIFKKCWQLVSLSDRDKSCLNCWNEWGGTSPPHTPSTGCPNNPRTDGHGHVSPWNSICFGGVVGVVLWAWTDVCVAFHREAHCPAKTEYQQNPSCGDFQFCPSQL